MHRRFPRLATPRTLVAAALAACAGGEGSRETAAAAEPPPAAATATSEWQVRADQGHESAEGFALAEAVPGWRISSGGFSGILWRPDQAGTGTYEVITTIHVLPGSRRTEGYGILVGGAGLGGDAQRYTYVLLRNDGKYLIKTRDGGSTSTVVDWTDAAAIRTLPASAAADESAANTIVLQVTPNAITLVINGERVLRRPRGDLPLDGIVGLRVNHGLELHIHALDVGLPAAPAE